MTPAPPPRKRRMASLALLLIGVVIAGGVVWWLESTGPPIEQEPILTEEAKAYTQFLDLANVEMKGTDNALGQTLVEIEGRITNTGDRAVSRVQLTCLFYEINGIEIMRERVAIVRSGDGPLGPGESRRFRLPFEAIPDGWNQTMPRLAIAEILFE